MIVPKILVFAGSVRSGAYSGRTADAATRELAAQGAEVTRISLADYPLPLMDEDLERESGVPDNAVKLARQFVAHDALVICTPEYNASYPALEEALQAAGVSFTKHTYAGTNHGFHNNSTPRYNEAAADLAWERTIGFFKQHLA